MFGSGLAGLATAWLATTGMAFLAIKRHLYEQHKEWMIRSYVVTFAFVIFRAFDTMIASRMPLLDHIGISAWFCWSVPLLLNEVVLQGRKILASERTRLSGGQRRAERGRTSPFSAFSASQPLRLYVRAAFSAAVHHVR